MRKYRAFGPAFVLGVAAALIGAAGARAERKPLDGIVAVVNDDVILASELGEEVSVRLYQLGPAASSVRDLSAFTGDVLSSMIDARLLIQDADSRDIVVTKTDIEPYVQDDLARIRKSAAEAGGYEATLARYGMTEKDLVAQLRKNVRDQLKITRFTEAVLAPRISLDEAELRSYYESHRVELSVPAVVTLREIAVAKEPSPAAAAAARAQLEELRAAARADGDFAARAERLAAAAGGDFGASFTFKPGEAVPGLARAAAGLSPGEFSEVTAGSDGLWLVRLVAVEDDARRVDYIHLPLALTAEDVARARRRAEAAAAALAGGEPFPKVAWDYNDNKDIAALGGAIGDVNMTDLQEKMPKVAAAVAALSPGGVTPIIERPEGFFIIGLDERKEGRDVSYEEARDQIKRLLRAKKLGQEQERYLRELKDKAYIKVFR